jgi:hypothetical protein
VGFPVPGIIQVGKVPEQYIFEFITIMGTNASCRPILNKIRNNDFYFNSSYLGKQERVSEICAMTVYPQNFAELSIF